jgi:hypothetical protein
MAAVGRTFGVDVAEFQHDLEHLRTLGNMLVEGICVADMVVEHSFEGIAVVELDKMNALVESC